VLRAPDLNLTHNHRNDACVISTRDKHPSRVLIFVTRRAWGQKGERMRRGRRCGHGHLGINYISFFGRAADGGPRHRRGMPRHREQTSDFTGREVGELVPLVIDNE
jgi:hypothetical protein